MSLHIAVRDAQAALSQRDIAQGAGLALVRAEILRLHMKLRSVRADIKEVEVAARGEIRRLELKLRSKQSDIAAVEREARKTVVAGRVVWDRP